jgi:hypothetical protein
MWDDGKVYTVVADGIGHIRKIVRYCTNYGTTVAQWLRYCATNRKVAGSIPADIIGFFC